MQHVFKKLKINILKKQTHSNLKNELTLLGEGWVGG